MAYYWTTEPELAESVQVGFDLELGFDDQGAAEAWLTDYYSDLANAGVLAVTLWDDSRFVYGPMELAE